MVEVVVEVVPGFSDLLHPMNKSENERITQIMNKHFFITVSSFFVALSSVPDLHVQSL